MNMSFTSMMNLLYATIQENEPRLRGMLENRARLYSELTRIAYDVSVRYGVTLLMNFPDSSKIINVERYGKENISIIVDKFRKKFPIPRDVIKAKAKEIFRDAELKDAYMYEGKEGLKIFFREGRMDILPGSLHIWRVIDDDVKKFCDWLMSECYKIEART